MHFVIVELDRDITSLLDGIFFGFHLVFSFLLPTSFHNYKTARLARLEYRIRLRSLPAGDSEGRIGAEAKPSIPAQPFCLCTFTHKPILCCPALS
ncbi:hypothetical protein L204_102890 [Cryptococcus depauperatus]